VSVIRGSLQLGTRSRTTFRIANASYFKSVVQLDFAVLLWKGEA
jgi:hypothetical protein